MSETVIKCESVYKIFGENAKKMLKESNGNVDAKTFQDGSTYEGEWSKGFMNGQGTFTWADGKQKTGTWINGKLQE